MWPIGIFAALMGIGLSVYKRPKKLEWKLHWPEASPMYTAESWRELANKLGGEIPTDFILEWIRVESGGNPCATGGHLDHKTGIVKETGLFQFYYPDDYQKLGILVQDFRIYCEGGIKDTSQKCSRELTSSEMEYHLSSGLKLVRRAIVKAERDLANVGANWGRSSDFWKMVKLQHNLPILSSPGLKMIKRYLGHAPKDWAEYKLAIVNNPSLWGRYSKDSIIRILDNADRVGGSVTDSGDV